MDVTIAQHSSIQANAMGVDYDGKYSVLGTRNHIIIIDLNNPQLVARRLNRQSKWDISNLQWSPCHTKKEYFVATYNQWADLWTWNGGAGSLKATLKGHTRVISDVDWSPCDENLLATCSIDTFIYVWDIRDTKRPKMTPSAVAGASQVKWNKLNPNILATAHDGDIRVWDIRNGRTPTQYITAHLLKIYSLDWSPTEPDILASSSQDSTVKFWDVSKQLFQASYQIEANAPVWKARYTPFGHGMVTALMPQMHRWDNSILLWNVRNVHNIVHSYSGHRNVVLDFGWRYDEEGTSAELVTWSKDHSLRLWKANSSLLSQCGVSDLQDPEINLEDETFDNINIAAGDHDSGLQLSLDNMMLQSPNMGSEYSIISKKTDPSIGMLTPRSGMGAFRPQELPIEPHSPRYSMSPSPLAGMPPSSSLEREFKLMNIDLPNLYIDEADPFHRTCTTTVHSNHLVAKLLISFPHHYPNNSIPNFQFIKPTNLSKGSLLKLFNLLREVAQNHVRSNLTCLEPCLRMLSNQVERIANSDLNSQDTSYIKQQSFGFDRIFGTYQDLVNIPFPRTSGARFCGAGQLVTFMRPMQIKGFEANSEPTPRCLATLMTFRNNNLSQKQMKIGALLPVVPNIGQFDTSPTENSEISVKSFYYKEKKSRKWKHHFKESTGSTSEPRSSDKLQQRLYKDAGKVIIQDLSSVSNLNRKLAEEYVVPSKHNYHVTCAKNREAARKLGREDIVQLWSSLELIQSSALHETSSLMSLRKPWSSSFCGKGLLTSIIDHYTKLLDVQTLAMISCMFAHDYGLRQDRNQSWYNISSPFPKSSSFNSCENSSSNSSHRSNSFCENPADPWWMKNLPSPTSNMTSFIESPTDSDYRYIELPIIDQETTDQSMHERLKELLDLSKQVEYDAFKQVYAEILDRWKLINQKTEILKYTTQPSPGHLGLVFMISCQHCKSETTSSRCISNQCRKFAINCALCQIPVKKLISFCFMCGHGGHADHMESWFESYKYCATGCGCKCRP